MMQKVNNSIRPSANLFADRSDEGEGAEEYTYIFPGQRKVACLTRNNWHIPRSKKKGPRGALYNASQFWSLNTQVLILL